MRWFILFLFSLQSLACFSQGDTLFLFNNCYIMGGEIFNQNKEGEKDGNWLEYGLKKESVIAMNVWQWSGFDSLGNDVSGHYYIDYKYAPTGDYTDRIFHEIPNPLFTMDDTTLILNSIPPEKYYISTKGMFNKGLKEGVWLSYYEDGQLKKKVTYKNGVPVANFQIFREDGSVMFSVSILDDGTFEICKFYQSPNPLKCSFKSFEEIRVLID
jgi:hypothetical protein